MNEEEAKERLNRYKTIKVLYGNTYSMHLEQLEQLQNDIETVLNLLKKKDKQIDEMAKEINKITSEKYKIKHICEKGKCVYEECHEDDWNECIKQYFEKKVEEDKNEK